jgi:hypothetical protein
MQRKKVEPVRVGWYEEYRCGCLSETVKRKCNLHGYCPRHGESRKCIHAEVLWKEEQEGANDAT